MRMAGEDPALGALAEQWNDRNEHLFEMQRINSQLGLEQERMNEIMRMRTDKIMRLLEPDQQPRDVWKRNQEEPGFLEM